MRSGTKENEGEEELLWQIRVSGYPFRQSPKIGHADVVVGQPLT